jgi:hypothetical protein
VGAIRLRVHTRGLETFVDREVIDSVSRIAVPSLIGLGDFIGSSKLRVLPTAKRLQLLEHNIKHVQPGKFGYAYIGGNQGEKYALHIKKRMEKWVNELGGENHESRELCLQVPIVQLIVSGSLLEILLQLGSIKQCIHIMESAVLEGIKCTP